MQYTLNVSRARGIWDTLDPFTQAYIGAAMWTLTDNDGRPCDHLDLHDIALETVARACEDCAQFKTAYAVLLDQAGTSTQNGHDFWLTRNHHGAGYWDRGYPEAIEQALTNAAHAEGEINWYVGDTGLVYQE